LNGQVFNWITNNIFGSLYHLFYQCECGLMVCKLQIVLPEHVVEVEKQFVVWISLHLLPDLEVKPTVRLAREQDVHYIFTWQQFVWGSFGEQVVEFGVEFLVIHILQFFSGWVRLLSDVGLLFLNYFAILLEVNVFVFIYIWGVLWKPLMLTWDWFRLIRW